MRQESGLNYVTRLCIAMVVVVAIVASAGSHARESVLLPAMEVAWEDIREDAALGGAEPALLDAFEADLAARDQQGLLLHWPAVRADAEAGIGARLATGDITSGVASSLV